MKIARGVKLPRSGYFFRAESFFNLATKAQEYEGEDGALSSQIDDVLNQPFASAAFRSCSGDFSHLFYGIGTGFHGIYNSLKGCS